MTVTGRGVRKGGPLFILVTRSRIILLMTD
jgi:hypothetical protein